MSKMSLTKSQDGSRIPERGKTEVMSLVFDKKTSTLETPKNKMSGRPSQGTASVVTSARKDMRTKSEIISGDKKLVSPLGKDGKLKNETEYEYGSKCNVCLRLFHQLKGIVQQHCQFCGKSVCKECSTNKIEDARICDICFFKASNKRADERRKDILKSKEEAIKKCKINIERVKRDMAVLEKKLYEANSEGQKSENNHNENLLTAESEYQKAEELFSKKKDTLGRLKQNVESERELVRDLEREYEKLRVVLNALRLDVQQQSAAHLLKLEEYNRLNYQKMKYEQSPSFAEYCEQGLQGVGDRSRLSLMVKSYVSVMENNRDFSYRSGSARETFGKQGGTDSLKPNSTLPIKKNSKINDDSVLIETKRQNNCGGKDCIIF